MKCVEHMDKFRSPLSYQSMRYIRNQIGKKVQLTFKRGMQLCYSESERYGIQLSIALTELHTGFRTFQ